MLCFYMSFCAGAIKKLISALGVEEAKHYYALAKKQQTIENKWKREAEKFINEMNEKVLDMLVNTGIMPTVDFTPLILGNAFEAAREGFKSTEKSPKNSKLAAPRTKSVPRSLRELMKMWDEYRKNGKVPPRQKELADKIKKQYIKKVEQFWDTYGRQFREGQEYDRERAVKAIREKTKISYARSKMIVETETTHYYNEVRRKVYDQSDDVTHYLYMAIRDHATTKWCKTRDGMVLEKGTELLDVNTPPVHWNCRSEIIPLVPGLNPRHAQLVKDSSRKPSNRTLEPLPSGWGRR